MNRLEERLALLRRYYRDQRKFGVLRVGWARRYWKRRARRVGTRKIIRLENNILCRIDAADRTPRRLWVRGRVNTDIQWVTQKFIRPGSIAVDVGTNIGLVALQMHIWWALKGQCCVLSQTPT